MASPLPPSSRPVARVSWRTNVGAEPVAAARTVPVEIPVAFSLQGATHAVMMATPGDLEDFAVGFLLTEQLVSSLEEIEGIAVQPVEAGLVVQLTLSRARSDAFWQRRRHAAGPSGCGLCGIESLEEAARMPPAVTGELRVPARDLAEALAAMMPLQALGRATRAVHAAAFWTPGHGIVAIREDVGRHNALDKLIGALARSGVEVGQGIALMTSRVSVELVQKAAIAGITILVAVSAPTSLAISVADAAGLTLVAVARDDGFEIFTHPRRILFDDENRVRQFEHRPG